MKEMTEREREQRRAASRRYYQKNKALVAAGARQWVVNNRERANAYAKRRRDAMTAEERRILLFKKRCEKLERLFGITMEQYIELLEKQQGLCALCRKPDPKKNKYAPLNVDHCHKTGRIRGLLCTPCNHALGILGDDAEGLERALAYVR